MVGRNNEPIKIEPEMYECPKCHERIEDTYEEAKKHVDVPLDTPFPMGLVFNMDYYDIVVTNSGFFGTDSHHGSIDNVQRYEPSGNFVDRVGIHSKYVKLGFEMGHYSLLDEKRFKSFQKKFSKGNFHGIKLIRTTPELEKLVSSKK